MKIIETAFVILVFNLAMGIASHTFETHSIYYESEAVNAFQPGTGALPDNITTSSETQQYSSTMGIVDVIFSVTNFGWIRVLIPDYLQSSAEIYILALQAIVGFFYAIAIIEMFVKYSSVLGGSGG